MGKFILLSFHLGHFEDISLRTHKVFQNEGNFLVEDTRSFKNFLKQSSYSIQGKNIRSLHDHSSVEKLEKIISEAKSGEVFYILSECGSSLLSDPSYPLIKMAIEEEIEVDSYPGSSSFLMAIELSGLPPIPVHFHGFFPRKQKEQIELIENCLTHKGSHFFFESCHRINSTLEVFKNYQFSMSILKDLTTKYQKVWRGESKDLSLDWGKGQYILGFYSQGLKNDDFVNEVIKNFSHKKELAKILSKYSNKSSKEIYSELIG